MTRWSEDTRLSFEVRQALKVTCPLCDARPETSCVVLTGGGDERLLPVAHKARLNLGLQLHPRPS